MGITREDGYFTYETMWFSEIMVLLVVPGYRHCYRGTVISRMDERGMGW
jgi:hypothetical protein